MPNLPDLIIDVAEAELGCTENPPGSNRGQCVQRYQATTWLPGSGWPWCVAFAWTYVVWTKVLRKPCPYPTASVEQLESWARTHGWSVPVGMLRRGDLACLNHGEHVTIVHHPLPRGEAFAAIGGNQGNQVKISEYPRSAITTLIRVPVRLSPVPAAKPPRYEVVRGEGGQRKVVYLGGKAKALQVVHNLVDKGARKVTVTKVPRKP
jgi:hypothetical protein